MISHTGFLVSGQKIIFSNYGSIIMHSPGHSSADSITASSCPLGTFANPSAPPTLPCSSEKILSPSLT